MWCLWHASYSHPAAQLFLATLSASQCSLNAIPCTAPQVIYSHAQAKALHHAPLFIVLLLPLLGEGAAGV